MDTRALGGEFSTNVRNPLCRNENRNTICPSDPAQGRNEGAVPHSEEKERGRERERQNENVREKN